MGCLRLENTFLWSRMLLSGSLLQHVWYPPMCIYTLFSPLTQIGQNKTNEHCFVLKLPRLTDSWCWFSLFYIIIHSIILTSLYKCRSEKLFWFSFDLQLNNFASYFCVFTCRSESTSLRWCVWLRAWMNPTHSWIIHHELSASALPVLLLLFFHVCVCDVILVV